MVGSADERLTSRRRKIRSSIGILVIVGFFGFGWLDRTEEASLTFGDLRRIVVISDAGPVEVASGEENRAHHVDSFMLRGPTIELATDDDEAVFRVRCETSWPCRATTSIEVKPGTELLVIATGGTVQVSSFSGDLTVFASAGEVLLGPVAGSARVVSDDGDVAGFGLSLDELTVEVDDAELDLEFAQSPASVVLTSDRGSVDLSLPDTGYDLRLPEPDERDAAIDLQLRADATDASSASAQTTETTDEGPGTVAIRANGTITVRPFEE